MNKSYVIAATFGVVAAGWILSGQFGDRTPPAGAETAQETQEPVRRVRVRTFAARNLERDIILRGRTEASRSVTLRAETPGRIGAVPGKEGTFLRKGAIVARIVAAERTAALEEAKALLRQREVEYNAAKALAKKGYRAGTKLAEAAALFDAARAQVAQMETDMARTVIRAPFDGWLETREAELGDYLKVGDPVARIVDLDPVLVVGSVSEREVDDVRLAQRGSATLVNGRVLEGKVRYIASVANPATRTFRIELEVPNAEGHVRDGVTSEIRIPATPVRAHFLSPALLTLDDDGRLGVKTVNDDDRVVFHPVRIISDQPGGSWVDGLPNLVRLITVGHEFVRGGQKVIPVPDQPEGET